MDSIGAKCVLFFLLLFVKSLEGPALMISLST
uniref:Uncharacterized protein n=1 Tax=Rhizophora mucronata TaxID=61149 RepID=A0A2P2KUE5_RHIMU